MFEICFIVSLLFIIKIILHLSVFDSETSEIFENYSYTYF